MNFFGLQTPAEKWVKWMTYILDVFRGILKTKVFNADEIWMHPFFFLPRRFHLIRITNMSVVGWLVGCYNGSWKRARRKCIRVGVRRKMYTFSISSHTHSLAFLSFSLTRTQHNTTRHNGRSGEPRGLSSRRGRRRDVLGAMMMLGRERGAFFELRWSEGGKRKSVFPSPSFSEHISVI